MPFKRILGSVVDRVPGAVGAILADWEGEAVDQVAKMDDYELKVIGAHKGIILDRLRALAPKLNGNRPDEIVITSEKARSVVLPVNDDYFVVLFLDRDSCASQASYYLQRCREELRREID